MTIEQSSPPASAVGLGITQSPPLPLPAMGLEAATRGADSPFLYYLAGELAQEFGSQSVIVAELTGENESRLTSLVFWRDGEFLPQISFEIADTTLAQMTGGVTLFFASEALLWLPEEVAVELGFERLMAVPAVDDEGTAVGALLLFDFMSGQSPEVFSGIARIAAHEIVRLREIRSLERSEQRLRDLYENAPIAYFSVDAEGIISEANRRACDLVGFDVAGLRGMSVLQLYADSSMGKPKALELLHRFQAGGPIDGEELEMLRADGHSVWVGLSVDPVLDEVGRVVASRSAVIDLTSRRALEAELREKARRDPLTAALNHGAILEELERKVEGAGEFSVCMIDLDDFKRVNDLYGHLAGDAVLTAVAEALQAGNAAVGRYGGDEFLVIIDGAKERAERFKREITEQLACIELTDSETVCITISLGFAHYPGDARSALELIRRADVSMYEGRRAA